MPILFYSYYKINVLIKIIITQKNKIKVKTKEILY